MSQTAAIVNQIKHQLDNIEPSLHVCDPIHRTIRYIINQLWPGLEAAIKQDLPEA
jgi:hypothetical protein